MTEAAHPTDELPPVVRIRCPECGTETTVDSDEARETLHTHDEKRHDGEQTAGLKVRTDDGFTVLPHPDDVVSDGGIDQPTNGTRRWTGALERYPKRPDDPDLPAEMELLQTEAGMKWAFREIGLRVEVDGDEFVPDSVAPTEGYVVLRKKGSSEGMIAADDGREVRIYADMTADLLALGGDTDATGLSYTDTDQDGDDLLTDGGEDQPEAISREERVEIFDEEHVHHTEWWSQEMGRIDDAVEDIISQICDAEDLRLDRRGKSVNKNGIHEFSLRMSVAGEGYLPPTDRCPNCGAEPADVSWQTAPGQLVCPTDEDECPVNTWDGGRDE